MNRSQVFLDYYNRIENHLKQQGNFESRETFTHKVKHSKNKAAKYNSDELISLGELRNAIVHHNLIKEKAIAEPHEETVKRIQELHDIITSPEKVIPRFQCEIFGAKVEDLIQDHLIEMKKHSYSQFPVYNHEGTIMEIINTNTISRWLSTRIEEDGTLLADNTSVKELIPEIEYQKNFKLVSKNASIYDAYDLFFTHMEGQQHNLDAIFITNSGRSSEELLGIITIEDIAGIV